MGTLVLFALSYIVSRVMVRVDAHVWLVGGVLRRCGGSGARFLLALMMTTLLVSAALPNMITVLAISPLVGVVVKKLGVRGGERDALVTTLMLGVVYAANVGGVASLVGSPSNGIVLVAIAGWDLPHLESLGFFRWLAFGVPLSMTFILGAWGILMLARPRTMRVSDFDRLDLSPVEERNDLKIGGGYILLCASVGLGLSVVAPLIEARFGVNSGRVVVLVVGGALGLLAFFIPLPDRRERLVRVRDLVGGIPMKGLVIACVAGALGVVLDQLGVVSALGDWLSRTVPDLDARFVIVLSVFATIFLSEVFSNIGTAAALWPLSAAMLDGDPSGTFLAFLGIGLACNCAFMSPLATPASGMAFGAVPGVSLRAMLGVGFFVDLLMGTLIAGSLLTWIPRVLGVAVP